MQFPVSISVKEDSFIFPSKNSDNSYHFIDLERKIFYILKNFQRLIYTYEVCYFCENLSVLCLNRSL